MLIRGCAERERCRLFLEKGRLAWVGEPQFRLCQGDGRKQNEKQPEKNWRGAGLHSVMLAACRIPFNSIMQAEPSYFSTSAKNCFMASQER
jgi:hypothetical protein